MLELVGHDIRVRCELERRVGVVVGTDHDPVRDRGGRTLGIGVEHDDPVAHRTGREPQHAAQLTAAENADHCRRKERRGRLGHCAGSTLRRMVWRASMSPAEATIAMFLSAAGASGSART